MEDNKNNYLRQYGGNAYKESRTGENLWDSTVIRKGASSPEEIIALVTNIKESFDIWIEGFTNPETGRYLVQIADGFVESAKNDIYEILKKDNKKLRMFNTIENFFTYCTKVINSSPDKAYIEMKKNKLGRYSKSAIDKVRELYNLPKVDTNKVFKQIVKSDDPKYDKAREYLSQYSTEEQNRILDLVVNHKFLKNFIDNPEILFQPIENIKEKDGWKEKPIEESNEPLVALNDYVDGKATRLHEKIFPKPEYFDQGIEHAMPIIYVREGVAYALLKYVDELPEGYAILAYDGYRPISVQQSLYDKFYAEVLEKNPEFSDEELENETKKFVSVPSRDPKCPSTHNTGGAVDFRICDENGNELNYACGFDDFRSIANLDFFEKKFKEGGQWRENELEALLIKRTTGNLARMSGIKMCCYLYEDWHFNKFDQWDLETSVSIYGSCDHSGIEPNPEYTILDIMRKMEIARSVNSDEFDKFGNRINKTDEEIQTEEMITANENKTIGHKDGERKL